MDSFGAGFAVGAGGFPLVGTVLAVACSEFLLLTLSVYAGRWLLGRQNPWQGRRLRLLATYSVSYTHLDVYKRQIKSCKARLAINFSSLVF